MDPLGSMCAGVFYTDKGAFYFKDFLGVRPDTLKLIAGLVMQTDEANQDSVTGLEKKPGGT